MSTTNDANQPIRNGIPETIQLISGEGFSVNVDVAKLTQKSAYYRSLVFSGMRDSNAKELKLEIISTVGLNAVADFLSYDRLDVNNRETTNLENVNLGLFAAEYLQMDDLVVCFSCVLRENISLGTWYQVLEILNLHDLTGVRDVVLRFICENFPKCSASEDFNLLPLGDILVVLSDDNTNSSEQQIFDVAFRCLSFDKVRFDDVDKVFDAIRFALMTDVELSECRNIVVAAELMEICGKYLDSSKKTNLRCATGVIVATGGFTSKEYSTSRFQILPIDDLQRAVLPKLSSVRRRSSSSIGAAFLSNKKEKLPETLCEHGTCVLDNILYIAGGQTQYCSDGRYTTNRLHCFDPKLCLWSECSKMSVPRSLFYFGELGGYLYAVSGYSAPNCDTPTVERYCAQTDKWHMVAPLLVKVHELAGCSHQGSLYVSGGFRGPHLGHVNLVWKYDPSKNVWETRASLIKPRSYHVMASVGDQILVAGGVRYLGNDEFEDLLDCERYDPESNQWTTVTKLFRPASCMSHVLTNNLIYIFGGHSFENDSDHNYIQTIDSKTFECGEFTFEAQKISYFATTIMQLLRKYIERFHR